MKGLQGRDKTRIDIYVYSAGLGPGHTAPTRCPSPYLVYMWLLAVHGQERHIKQLKHKQSRRLSNNQQTTIKQLTNNSQTTNKFPDYSSHP